MKQLSEERREAANFLGMAIFQLAELGDAFETTGNLLVAHQLDEVTENIGKAMQILGLADGEPECEGCPDAVACAETKEMLKRAFEFSGHGGN